MSETIAERAASNPAATLTGSELVPVDQGGTGKVATMEQIAALFGLTAGVKVYRAKLSQAGTNAPVATVFQNTIGAIVLARDTNGIFTATLAGAFPDAKVFIPNPKFYQSPPSIDNFFVEVSRSSDDQIGITTSDGTGSAIDDVLSLTPIEILVFP